VQHWQLDPPKILNESLYKLPNEKRDILPQNRDVADRLRVAANTDPLPPPELGDQMSDEMRAKLRALGYLH
jgi:hypothetical protein